MRAVVVWELGGPDALQLAEVPEPEGAHPHADGDRLLVEVHATGVAFPDLLQSRGEYQLSVPPPFVTGGEVAGVVREAPPGSPFSEGDRVAGMTIWGGMAELALAIPKFTVKLPDAMSFAEGAALWLNYATAWFAIERAGVRHGETVLVHGAAGGVGTAVLDILRTRDTRSIAVVSSEEKERVARDMGADEVVRSTGPWLQEVRELTGGLGVEVVLDPVGGDRFTDSLRALDVAGRLVVIGFAGGSIPTVKVNRLLLRNLTVLGIGIDPMDRRFPGTVLRIGAAVQDLAEQGRIRPLIGRRLPMADGAESLRILERREAVGKVVVDVRPDGAGSA
jgi:NADPH2:quinone reductase